MQLRKLKLSDAPLMLEWMHDKSVVHDMGTDFFRKTLEDCKNFINSSQNFNNSLHMAVTDEQDIYMGTVSLKNINPEKACGEFAIAMRKTAMGKGFSIYGMKGILRIGFEELGLNMIYWYVSKSNTRAIRFYEKNGFQAIDWNTGRYCQTGNNYFWYILQKDNFFNRAENEN